MPVSQFDHEKLEVYRVQLGFVRWLAELVDKISSAKPRRVSEVLDQLDRASLSVLLNIAEGNGRRATPQRVRFFDDARGSATECAACLDALVAKRALNEDEVAGGKGMLIRVVSMLSRLIERFSVGMRNDLEEELSRTSRSRSRRTREP